MLQQLLWIEVLAKLTAGLVLVVAPRTLARMLGLPPADEAFWPRLLGAVLLGIAAAAFVELRLQPGKSLGLTGIVAINLTLALGLGSLLILGKAGPTKRGRAVVAAAAALLLLASLIAIVSAL